MSPGQIKILKNIVDYTCTSSQDGKQVGHQRVAAHRFDSQARGVRGDADQPARRSLSLSPGLAPSGRVGYHRGCDARLCCGIESIVNRRQQQLLVQKRQQDIDVRDALAD